MQRFSMLPRIAGLAMATSLLVSLPVLAQGQPDNLQIPRGFDVFQTLPEFPTLHDFGTVDSSGSEICAIPGSDFEGASDQVLTGCEPFNGVVQLAGRPIEDYQGTTVGAVDTIVERKQAINFGDPQADVTVLVPVELKALNLGSVTPIRVACNEKVTEWDVHVEVDQQTGPSEGEMEVTLEYPELRGGTVNSQINVCPRITFTRVDAGGSGSFELNPCIIPVCGPKLIGETTWELDLPEDAVLQIDGFTTANFHFTGEIPEEMLQGRAAEKFGRAETKNGSCVTNPCPSLYPHQDATAAHLACTPNPCAADIQPPVLTPPAPITLECSEQGGTPYLDPQIQAWESQLTVQDANQTTFGAKNPPSFFPSGCGNTGGVTTPVDFSAQDCCGNNVTVSSTVTVVDTTGPAITQDLADKYCISPTNHRYVCFDRDDFSPTIADVCGSVPMTDGWFFTGCPSDQPDDASGLGDGSTTQDCSLRNNGQQICVRAERSNSDPDGRRYSVRIHSRDDCNNFSGEQIIGRIHVPSNQSNAPANCIKPPSISCDVTPTEGYGPLTVDFTDTSDNQAEITGWAWDFDGNSTTDSTDQNPTHTYTTPGNYQATLMVFESSATGLVNCPAVTVKGIVPGCSAVPTGGAAPLTVDFADTSQAFGTTITSWAWDFDGNGTIDSTQQTPNSFIYPSDGIFTPTLTVSDGTVSQMATCPTVIVSPQPMIMAACDLSPQSGPVPLTVTGMDQSTAANTTITSWEWDFDNNGIIDSTAQNPTFVYNTAGTYSPTLTVSDGTLTDTATCLANGITATPPVGPIAACTASPDSGDVSLDVTFSDQSTPGSSPITDWEWDFDGNGTVDDNGTNVTHTFTVDGVYNSTLTVTDANGLSSSATCPVTVTDPRCFNTGLNPPGGGTLLVDIEAELGLPPGSVTINGIYQDEPLVQIPGDSATRGCGNKPHDGCIQSAHEVELRLEACSSGAQWNGRYYHIDFDVAGGATPPCGGNLVICRTQNQGTPCDPADDEGALFDSTDGGLACPLP